MMVDNPKSVKSLEEKLRKELDKIPAFNQWLSVKTTLDLLENGTMSNGVKSMPRNGFEMPDKFSEDLTWRQKVMFAVFDINSGFIADIVDQLKKLGAKQGDDFLYKRVSITASKLREDGFLRRKKEGKLVKYFI